MQSCDISNWPEVERALRQKLPELGYLVLYDRSDRGAREENLGRWEVDLDAARTRGEVTFDTEGLDDVEVLARCAEAWVQRIAHAVPMPGETRHFRLRGKAPKGVSTPLDVSFEVECYPEDQGDASSRTLQQLDTQAALVAFPHVAAALAQQARTGSRFLEDVRLTVKSMAEDMRQAQRDLRESQTQIQTHLLEQHRRLAEQIADKDEVIQQLVASHIESQVAAAQQRIEAEQHANADGETAQVVGQAIDGIKETVTAYAALSQGLPPEAMPLVNALGKRPGLTRLAKDPRFAKLVADDEAMGGVEGVLENLLNQIGA